MRTSRPLVVVVSNCSRTGCCSIQHVRSFSSAKASSAHPQDGDEEPTSSALYGDSMHPLPKHGRLETDFFGEPVTFLGLTRRDDDNPQPDDNKNNTAPTTNAMAALNGFLLAAVSKGRTCIGGGLEAGLEVRAAHAVALEWAEVLRHAAVWNGAPEPEDGDDDTAAATKKSAPMLACVAVAPLLAQTGKAYVKHLDTLLAHAAPGAPGLPDRIQFEQIATAAAAAKDDPHLQLRERLHLRALDCLWNHNADGATALALYLQILASFPGDALAMSQALDLALVRGDKEAALRCVRL